MTYNKKSPLAKMLSHAVVGTMMFIIIAIPAVLLFFLVGFLKELGVDPYTIQVLTLLEHAIVTIDVLAVLAYIVITSWHEVQGFYDKGNNRE